MLAICTVFLLQVFLKYGVITASSYSLMIIKLPKLDFQFAYADEDLSMRKLQNEDTSAKQFVFSEFFSLIIYFGLCVSEYIYLAWMKMHIVFWDHILIRR